MACGFCATGQAGFDRHLTTGEIVEQVVRGTAARRADRRVSNVVFMGMGEPLANYDSVWAAVERLHGDHGPLRPPPHGVDGRHRARHSAARRASACPSTWPCRCTRPTTVARRARADQPPLPARDRLREACQDYVRSEGPAALVRVGADRRRERPPRQTRAELAAYARPLRAHVNLIPLNPTPGLPTRGTPPAGVRAFRDRLRELGRQRDRPPQPRHRHRRRLRPTFCGGHPVPSEHARRCRRGPPAPPVPRTRRSPAKHHRTSTVVRSPARIARRRCSAGRTTAPGQTTQRIDVPSTAAPVADDRSTARRGQVGGEIAGRRAAVEERTVVVERDRAAAGLDVSQPRPLVETGRHGLEPLHVGPRVAAQPRPGWRARSRRRPRTSRRTVRPSQPATNGASSAVCQASALSDERGPARQPRPQVPERARRAEQLALPRSRGGPARRDGPRPARGRRGR